jgi:FkbM family methyltransferase
MLSTRVAPFTIYFENSEEFHRLKGEIFTQGTYYFETANPQPIIIDAGAHIGLTTLYLKKTYPFAHIFAIEPNPEVFPLLEKNIFENQLTQVEAIQIALSSQKGEIEFFMDETDEQWLSTASFTPGAWTKTQESKSVMVSTTTLTQVIEHALGEANDIDFLKMDIEGAEQEVLMEAGSKLRFIKQMMVEFHPLPHQSLPKLIEYLQQQGFRVQLWKDGKEILLGQTKKLRGLVYIEANRRK